MTQINPTLAVVYGELVLSLYPILLKTVNTSLFTQTLARFIVFPALALTFGPFSDFKKIWTDPYETFAASLQGLFNLSHVLVSYISFKTLPTGSAISLFYLYPIFNMIIGSVLFNESYPSHILLLIPLALIGTYLIASSETTSAPETEPFKDTNPQKEDLKKPMSKKAIGIAAAILAALTESVIFMFVRTNTDALKSPFYTVDHLYPAGLVALLLYGFSGKATGQNVLDTSPKTWAKLIGFNALLGFTGYIARFYGLAKISTALFSLLSFVGVVSAYIWGILFTGEKITKRGVIGSACIASSIAFMRYFGFA
jgi:drug/metabolite transporter (DMT)-like permease